MRTAAWLAVLFIGGSVCGPACATTCVTVGPSTPWTCPAGAEKLCAANELEEGADKDAAVAASVSDALAAVGVEARSYARSTLKYARTLDLTRFRDALLKADRLDEQDEFSHARSERELARRDLAEKRRADPESVTDSEIENLAGDPPRASSTSGEELLERWEWAHATRVDRSPVYAAAIERGSAPGRRLFFINRATALEDVCLGGLQEVRASVDAYFERVPPAGADRVGFQGCRLLLGYLDNGAPSGDEVEKAYRRLLEWRPVDLDEFVHADPALECALRMLSSLANTEGAKAAKGQLQGLHRNVVLARQAREQPQLEGRDMPRTGVFSFTGNWVPCLGRTNRNPCGWGGW